MADGAAVLLCLGCPAGITFGIDSKQWTVGPKFAGVRDIPPGLHFVHHTCGGHDSGSGEFLDVAGGEVFVRKWDDALETFAHEGALLSAEEVERVVAAARRGEYNAGLGPYPRGEVGVQWRSLTAHVTPRTLARASIAPGTRVVPGEAELLPADTAQLVPFVPGLARTPRFSPAAARKLPGMSAAEVTAHNLHPDARLARLLAADFSGETDEFVAEFELAFVLFLLLPSLPALEHWKAVLHLVSACTEHTPAWMEVARGTLRVLMQQLALTPEDLFEDALTSDNFLRKTLASLARSAASPAVPAELREAGVQLQNLVSSRFSLRISPAASSESADDEQPVVVEEDEESTGMEVGGAPGEPSEGEAAAAADRMAWMLPAP